jgi:hypothetical protein
MANARSPRLVSTACYSHHCPGFTQGWAFPVSAVAIFSAAAKLAQGRAKTTKRVRSGVRCCSNSPPGTPLFQKLPRRRRASQKPSVQRDASVSRPFSHNWISNGFQIRSQLKESSSSGRRGRGEFAVAPSVRRNDGSSYAASRCHLRCQERNLSRIRGKTAEFGSQGDHEIIAATDRTNNQPAPPSFLFGASHSDPHDSTRRERS